MQPPQPTWLLKSIAAIISLVVQLNRVVDVSQKQLVQQLLLRQHVKQMLIKQYVFGIMENVDIRHVLILVVVLMQIVKLNYKKEHVQLEQVANALQ